MPITELNVVSFG